MKLLKLEKEACQETMVLHSFQTPKTVVVVVIIKISLLSHHN